MGFDEAFRLDEHAAGAATRVEDAALVGFEHFDQEADDAAGGEEFAAELALGLGELAEEVFVDAAEHIAGAAVVLFEPDVRDEVDEPLHLFGVDAAAGVIARELVFEGRVVVLDGEDGVIDEGGNIGAGRTVLEVCPASLGRNPEDIFGGVFVAVFEERFDLIGGDAVGFELGLF